jgi:thioredoxin-related protein
LTNLTKKIETLANVAIIVVALVLAGVLVKRYLLPGETPASPPPAAAQIQPGTQITLADVDWAKSDQTLLLVLSDTCHFCTDSAGFYKRIVQEKSARGGARLIAVLPQDVEKGKAYLDKLGVSVDEVKQASLAAVGVRGTPTLILVDKAGKAVNSWVGQLPVEKEAEVLSHFRAERAGK